MTEPRIQYARTSDGVSIAYWTLGEGPTLIVSAGFPWTNIELEWRIQAYRHFYEKLAARARLVRYDARGCGCSQRDVSDFSLPALMLDVDAVADRLQLNRFALWTNSQACPGGIRYAALNPQRISRLILVGPFPRGAEMYESAQGRAMRALRDSGTDWNTLSEAFTRVTFGPDVSDADVRTWIDMLRECVNEEQALAIFRAIESFDVTDDLEKVQAPTLVTPYPALLPWPVPESVRAVASRIPDARFTGVSLSPGETNSFEEFEASDRLASIITDFVIEGEQAPSPDLPSGTAIILFADIVDSTALTERLGDAIFREKARELDVALRTIIRESGGTPIDGKLLGDGVLATFTSASQAIAAALACGKAGEEGGLALHLGIHAGDVIREENNVYGGAVNIAARIAGASAPGEVLVSDIVRGLARTSAGVTFEDRGEQELKGIEEPQRLFVVRGGADG